MKNIFIITVVFSVLLFSCSKGESDVKISVQKKEAVANIPLIKGYWEYSCVGGCSDCDTYLNGSTGTISCTCSSDCAMSISWVDSDKKNSQKKINVAPKISKRIISTVIETFNDKNLKLQDVKIKLFRHYISDEFNMLFVQYGLNTSQTESFVVFENSKGEMTVYDCYGECGCVEQIDINTGIVSCSCSPCKMDVDKK